MTYSAELRMPAPDGMSAAVLAAAADAILVCGACGTVRQVNAAVAQTLGYRPETLIGSAAMDIVPAVSQLIAEATARQQVAEGAAKAVTGDGRSLDVTLRVAPILEPGGELSGVCIALRPVSGLAGSRLAPLFASSHLIGHAFCESVVGALAKTLGVRDVLLAEIEDGRARTVAAWSNGQIMPNFSYAIAGTPCADAVQSRGCLTVADVAVRYPQADFLAAMGAYAYVGVPLCASDGRVIGLLAVLHDAPLDPELFPEQIMEAVAARAAAELERDAAVTYNEYLGRLLEGSLSEVFVFDAETLCFRLVNKAARENLGYSMAELRALTPLDLKPDHSAETFAALIAPLRSGEAPSVTFRTRHCRKNGSCYPVEVRLQLITGYGEPVFFAAIEDVTQRDAAEAALRLTDARLRRLFSQSPAGIVETDATGRMVLVNDTWCEMLGYSRDELLAMTVFEITHADSIACTQEAVADLAGGRDGVVIEKNYVRKDGSRLHASSNVSALRDEEGQFLGVAAVVLDITERVAAEERIRDKEALLRKILDGTLAFIGVLEPDGAMTEVNAPALIAGGLERADVIGRKFWDCYWWSHDPATMERLKDAVARVAQGEIVRYDAVVRMKDDTRMTIDFMLSPVRGEDGRVQYLVPSGFDISDRKRNEARVVSLMHEVNHRSKNLLTVVQSIARQMPKSTPEAFTREFGRRLQALAACQDLLIRSGWDDLPLESLIRSQLMHFVDLLGTRILLDGPPVTVSPTAAQTLGMAIYELTTNAAKYGALSNDAGSIAIRWSVAAGGRFGLDWQEAGGPPVARSERSGFGSVVLNHLVGMTLDADCATDLAPEGLRWRLDCALEKLRSP